MDLLNRSIEIIKKGQAASGAYVASPNFSQYGYSWLRDGTWIAYSMECVGEWASARAFYDWGHQTLLGQAQKVDYLLTKLAQGIIPDETDYLPTRFTLGGQTDMDTPWTDFQLDGYGTWLWGVCQHTQHDPAYWQTVEPSVKIIIRYLEALWQSPNYDCWEEYRHQIHPATLAAIYGGLKAVAQIQPELVQPDILSQIRQFVLDQAITPQQTIMKFLGNGEVDASLLWVALPYNLLDVHDPIFQNTLAKIETDLHTGGVYRYQADVYFGGGEWILLAAWLGWVYVELGRLAEAQNILDWISAQATPTGEFPEQTAQNLLHPEHYAEWVAKWGEVACPLLWSHAMYLILKTKLEKANVANHS